MRHFLLALLPMAGLTGRMLSAALPRPLLLLTGLLLPLSPRLGRAFWRAIAAAAVPAAAQQKLVPTARAQTVDQLLAAAATARLDFCGSPFDPGTLSVRPVLYGDTGLSNSRVSSA
jgi:hypothetical protein